MNLHRHDRPVLNSRVVCQAEDRPDYHILILHVITSRHGIRDSADFFAALQSVASCGVELVVLVFSHPDVVVSELSALRLDGFRVSEEQLSRWRNKLEANWPAANFVLLRLVDNFEDSVGLWLGISPGGLGDGRLANFIVVSTWVRLRIHRHWQRLFLDDGVVLEDVRVLRDVEVGDGGGAVAHRDGVSARIGEREARERERVVGGGRERRAILRPDERDAWLAGERRGERGGVTRDDRAVLRSSQLASSGKRGV